MRLSNMWRKLTQNEQPRNRSQRNRARLTLEVLEDRVVPATLNVTALGTGGWFADDMRSDDGVDLVGVTLSHAGKPGQTPTVDDDHAIALQVSIVAGPAGSTYGGTIQLDGTDTGPGKSNISNINTDTGFSPASVLATAAFNATFQWYGQTNPSSERVAFKIGIQSTEWAASQASFTALRSGESAWDLVLVFVPAANSDNAWTTETVDFDSGTWLLFDQAGNPYYTPPGNQPSNPLANKTLSDWNADSTWGAKLFGPGAKITSVQFGLGSFQNDLIAHVDYLQTSLLNGGDLIDFGGGPAYVDDQAADFVITFDSDSSGTLTNGDIVTWNPTGTQHSLGAATNLTFGANAFLSIQSAVDAVSAGRTINIAAGTYAEQVVIGKELTLQGAGATTIIKPTSASQLTSLYTTGTQSGAFFNGVILAGIIQVSGAAGSVTIKDLKVDGETVAAVPTGADQVVGIVFGETAGVIDTVIVEDMNQVPNTTRTFGMWLDAVNGTPVAVEVKSSTISLYNRNGLNARGDSLTVNIHDNIITGPGTVGPTQVPNGLLLIAGAGGTITANTITANHYTGVSFLGSGILLFSARDGIVVSGNDISDVDDAVLLSGTNLAIIQANLLHDNVKGVRLEAAAANNVISNNFITNNTLGIDIGDNVGAGNGASNNSITGSTTAAVNNLSVILFDASGNWFGVNTPADVAAAVSVNVDYTPWLHVGADSSVAAGFQGNSSTLHVDDDSPQVGGGRITEAIQLVSVLGAVVIIHSGAYTEDVNTSTKSVTLAPGASPGLVNITGNLTLDADDTLTIELYGTSAGSQYDQFVVSGDVALGGAHLVVTRGFNPAAGDEFILIDGSPTTTIGGNFNGLIEGATVTINSVQFTISYADNDVTLTTISTVAANAPLTFTDDDGDVYSVKLKGLGSMSVTIDDPDGDGKGPINQIVLSGTDPLKSTLSFSVKRKAGSDQQITIGSIIGSGLKSLNAPNVDLIGTGINLTGSLGKLVLDDISAGADVITGASPSQTTSIRVDLVSGGTQFNIGTPISSFRVTAMEDGSITAPSIKSLLVREDLSANITLAGALGTASIGGTLNDAIWDIGGDVRYLAVKELAQNWDLDIAGALLKAKFGDLDNASIHVDGSVKSFIADTFIDSELFAGFTSTGPMTGTFNSAQSINSFQVRERQVAAFDNSTVAAATIGKVSLSSVRVTDSGDLFGILADLSIGRVDVREPAFSFDDMLPTPQGFGKFQVDID